MLALRKSKLIALSISFVILTYSLVLSSEFIPIPIKLTFLILVYASSIALIMLKGKVKVYISKNVLPFFLFIFFLLFKDIYLYYSFNLTNEVIQHAVLRVVVCLLTFFIAINVTYNQEKAVINCFFVSSIFITILSVLFNIDVSGNVVLILALYSIIANSSPFTKVLRFSVIVFLSLYLDSRTGLIVLLSYFSHRAFLNVSFYRLHWVKIISLLLSFLILFQLYVSIYLYDDIYLNALLTKRPYIWWAYIDATISNNVNMLIGNGKISGDFAENVGAIVAKEFGVGRKYSAHSFYINIIYEHGFLSVLLFVFLLFKSLFKEIPNKFSIYNEYLLFTLVGGLVIPMYIGGVSIFDIFLTYFIFRRCVVNNENSTCN